MKGRMSDWEVANGPGNSNCVHEVLPGYLGSTWRAEQDAAGKLFAPAQIVVAVSQSERNSGRGAPAAPLNLIINQRNDIRRKVCWVGNGRRWKCDRRERRFGQRLNRD